MNEARAAIMFAGKVVGVTPGARGLSEGAAEYIQTHFVRVAGGLGEEGAFEQLLQRVLRRAPRQIELAQDGIITAANLSALHAHLMEISDRLERKGGCALC